MIDYDTCKGWVPLTLGHMPDLIHKQLHAPSFGGTELRVWVVEQFERQVGLAVDLLGCTNDEVARATRWWAFQFENSDIVFRKYPVLQPLLYGTLTEKATTLSQRSCQVCSGLLPNEQQLPRYFLSIRIEPESRQALDSVNWFAFQSAIRSRFTANNYDLSTSRHLCIALTFVLSNARPDRDVDNMAKALLDAFSRALGFDDKNVHHLDLLKLIDDFQEEYVLVRVAPSHLQNRSNVVLPITNHGWAGQPALRLADFVSSGPHQSPSTMPQVAYRP